jgi:hypothetical protein
MDNPADYLDYERRLIDDLGAVVKRPAVQLCTFRIANLRHLEVESGLSVGQSLASIAVSHRELVVVEGSRVATGIPAAEMILHEIGQFGGARNADVMRLRYRYLRQQIRTYSRQG